VKRLFLTCIAAAIFSTALGAADLAPRGSADDHLVPVPQYLGNVPLYRKLWQEKLFVTPGDVGRFVQLPGSVGVEVAVSVYQDARKSNGLRGGYWVTMTQPSVPLSQCYPSAGNEKPIDPRTVRIRRCDAPLPASTALAAHRAWLKMLKASRPMSNERSLSVDSTTEIFSARKSGDKVLEAQSPPVPLNSRSKVNTLIRYRILANGLLRAQCR
jgi:hypothetical protein